MTSTGIIGQEFRRLDAACMCVCVSAKDSKSERDYETFIVRREMPLLPLPYHPSPGHSLHVHP